MEKVNRENGGLVVYPGTHKTMEFVSHESPNWKEGVNRGYILLLLIFLLL